MGWTFWRWDATWRRDEEIPLDERQDGEMAERGMGMGGLGWCRRGEWDVMASVCGMGGWAGYSCSFVAHLPLVGEMHVTGMGKSRMSL